MNSFKVLIVYIEKSLRFIYFKSKKYFLVDYKKLSVEH